MAAEKGAAAALTEEIKAAAESKRAAEDFRFHL
jgi:hypothetical protein